MENLTLISSVLLVHLLGTISPGPDFILAVKNSMCYSRKTGMWTAIGFGLGISVHILYCLAGLAVIISQYIILFNAIKYLGAGYLIYLGIMAFISKKSEVEIKEEKKKKDISKLNAIKSGFFTNVLNPKATLFFLSIFTFVISPQTPFHIMVLISIGMVVITTLWFIFVSIFFTQNKMLNVFNRYQGIFNKTLGGALVLLGVKVALFRNK